MTLSIDTKLHGRYNTLRVAGDVFDMQSPGNTKGSPDVESHTAAEHFSIKPCQCK